MSGGIFVLNGEELVEMHEQPYDSEDLLQTLLARYPNLLAGGDQLAGSPRRWLLVNRETGVPDHEGGSGRWSLDHLFLDQEAVPTLVEVKRSTDTRIRREVVGQMLDYAANGIVYWPAERLRSDFESRCAKEDQEAEEVFRESLGDEVEPERFWDEVEQNLRSGRVRLVFVSDLIPAELRRVIEFLNERMSPTEVLGVEIKQYRDVGGSNLTTLVPRIVGQTEQAKIGKIGGSSKAGAPDVDWDYYESHLEPERFAVLRAVYDAMEKAINERGLAWVPYLRSGYLGFARQAGYFCSGVGIYRERPIEFWVKLPLAPDELRALGHELPNPYPQLVESWRAGTKEWHWAVPTVEDVPDIGPAIDATALYQPQSGPMPPPTS